MNCGTFDVILKNPTDTMNLSVISDLHAESPEVDKARLRRFLDERAALPNAAFVSIGDAFNSILPNDLKRFVASENIPEIADRDDMIDALVDHHENLLGKYPWIMFSEGNHELSCKKNNLTDLTNRLAKRCKLPGFIKREGGGGVFSGNYSGFIKLRFWDESREKQRAKGPRVTLDVAFTHGSWCGKNRGVAPAEEWALGMQGARLFLFGHSHKQITYPFDWHRTTQAGRVAQESGWIVNCGTWMNSHSPGRSTFAEYKGHKPYHVGSPLVQLSVRHNRLQGKQVGANVHIKVVNED